MIYYVLLTHGAKPTGNIADHPAGRQQVNNLRGYWNGLYPGTKPPRFVHDYCRKVSGLSTLPNLARELERILTAGQGAILMDNVGRLFAACERDSRYGLMAELLAYRDHFGGLRQRGLLSKLTDIELELLRNGVIGARYSNRAARQRHRLSEEERRAQTENATHASRIARGNAADKKARELYAVRDVLTEVHEKPTLKMIADEANHRGLTTTRGGPWSSSTVGRTLKRLEETTQTESTTHDETQEER